MDGRYGTLRDALGNQDANADGRQQWEVGLTPASTCTLDHELGASLAEFSRVASTSLLRSASRSLTFIWGMEANGDVKIAVEEVARINKSTVQKGFPTRRGIRKELTLDDKLGHPCIMSSKQARIAGELYLDSRANDQEGLTWTLNARSGRFHEPPERRPSATQLLNVAKIFANAFGVAVELERTRDFPPFIPQVGRPI